MSTYEIVESKYYLVTADNEDEAYRKFGNYNHDEESDYKTIIRKLDHGFSNMTESYY
jgi:hypothetical protein